MSRPTGRDTPLALLWFALLGGPAAWTAHLLGSYPLVPVACRMGTTAPLNILTAVTAVIALAAAATGWWAYRRSRGPVGADPARGSGVEVAEPRPAFMGMLGLMLALLFAFAILMEGLPPVLQDPCLRGL